MRPRYLSLDDVEFSRISEELRKRLESCDLCGNRCGVDRIDGEIGICGAGEKTKVSSANAHFGEEPPLVGTGGSGTIFLSHCPMECVYCQNWRISQTGTGTEKSTEELADIMLSLQERGCHNVNWVTPTHYVPRLVESLRIAANRGLEVPVVYNTGGYDNAEVIELLDGVIDIYMPDVKYGSNENGRRYSGVEGYWDTVRENLRKMHRQVGDLEINDRGVAEKGLLIRHLVLPDDVSKSKGILEFIAKEISKDTYVNIMSQYRPLYRAERYERINRTVRPEEVQNVKDEARELGLYRGFQ